MAKRIDPEGLFQFVADYAETASAEGKYRLWPTFKEAAVHFNCTYQDIEDAIEDFEGGAYMGAVVAYATGTGGAADIRGKGARLIEVSR